LDTFDAQGAYARLQAEASNLAAAFETAIRDCPEFAPALGRALAALHTAHGSGHDAASIGRRVREATTGRGGRAGVEGLLLHAELLHRVDVAQALDPYAEAAEAAEALGESRLAALAWYGTGNAVQWRNGPRDALAPTRKAAEAARQTRDLSLLADVENQLAFLEGQVGAASRDEVIQRLLASRETMLQAGQLRSVFLGTVRLAHMTHNAGHDDVSASARRQIALWARHLPSRRLQRIAWVEAGMSHMLEGRYREALSWFELALGDAERHGDPPGTTLVYHRGIALLNLGDLNGAAADFARAEVLAAAAGRHPDQAHAREGLALVALERGDLAQATAYVQGGLDLASTTGDHLLTSFLRAHGALILHLQGDPAAAIAAYRALDIDRLGMLSPTVLARLAAALLARGDAPAAAAALERLRTVPYFSADRAASIRLVEAATAQDADLGPWTMPPHGHEVRLLARALQAR
jgi:tetratricopeptide (TPR) repeat protein